MPFRLQTITFFVLLLAAFILVLAIWWPFLQLVAFAIVLAILFWPVHKRVLRRIANPSWAALVSVLTAVAVFLIPLALIASVVVKNLFTVYNNIKSGEVLISRQDIIARFPAQLQGVAENANRDLSNYISQFSSHAFQTASSLLSNVAGFVFALFLVLFALYYLFKDGVKIKETIMDLFPLSSQNEQKLFSEIESSVNGIVKGAFLMALIQGTIATIGFTIFGLPQPLLWGSFTVVAALIPTVGTSVAIIPAVAYLFISGHTGAAIGMAIWGVTAVGLIDNFLSPRIIGSRAKLHPFLVLFSVVGGLQLFGFFGFLLGPIVMAIFVAMVRMYKSQLV